MYVTLYNFLKYAWCHLIKDSFLGIFQISGWIWDFSPNSQGISGSDRVSEEKKFQGRRKFLGEKEQFQVGGGIGGSHPVKRSFSLRRGEKGKRPGPWAGEGGLGEISPPLMAPNLL